MAPNLRAKPWPTWHTSQSLTQSGKLLIMGLRQLRPWPSNGRGHFLLLLVAAQSQEIRWQFGWQFPRPGAASEHRARESSGVPMSGFGAPALTVTLNLLMREQPVMAGIGKNWLDGRASP
jgi:hypothetical protein